MATYKAKWKQSVQEPGQSSSEQSFKINTTDVIWNQQTLNAIWDNSGCYAGARAVNGSLMGSSSVANWTGWKSNEVYSDMRDVSINFGVPSTQQNLRFLVKYMNGSGQLIHQAYNWTGLKNETVAAIEQGYDNLTSSSSITIYDPYIKDFKNISITQSPNSPLCASFLTELKINDLIWVPYFVVKEVELSGFNDSVNGYTTITYSSNSSDSAYTWSQIKPQDKSAAGQYYDEDLFTNGYKEITPVNQDGVRYRYVAGAVLVPYYGKSSKIYNANGDNYTEGTNPDDNNVYGDRNIFGAIVNDSGDYPTFLNTTNLSSARLIVMTEVADATTNSVYYSSPTGIAFSSATPSGGTLQASSFTIQSSNYNVNSSFTKFTSDTAWTTFWNNNNSNSNNFYKDQDFSTVEGQVSPDLVVPATAIKVNVNVSDVYDSLPAGYIYFLDGNGPNIYGYRKANRTTYLPQIGYFAIQDLWATIASLGCYVADDTTCATKAQTGAYVGENNHLYLGYMDANGITNGTMLQGKDIENSTQAGIDDIIQNTPYTPVDPTGGSSGSDPSNPPTPSGKGEGKITGDNTTGHKTRIFGSGPITYYALKETEVRDLVGLLWSQTKDFYNAIQIAGRYNTSIFDYITSFKYYPSSLASMQFTVGATTAIKLGTGAVLKDSNGNYQANKLTGFFSQFQWCHWNLSSYTFWYPNDSFLNYGPYMKISIYLPYSGTYDLDPQTIAANNPINKATISVRVAIDLNTGTLTYYVDSDGVLILEKTVQFGIDLPLTGNDTIEQSKAILSSTYKNTQNTIGTISNLISSAASGNLAGFIESVASGFNSANEKGIESCLANRQIPTQVNSFGGTMSNITQGQDPYLTFYRQKIANPSNYGHAVGYLTESTQNISELKGFTICRNPDVSGINATQDEKNEIQSILTTGFYA